MATQDDRVSKTPLRRQPVLWAAGTAVLVVVGGVGWMIYSAEELDARLDRQAAVADAPGRQAELEQAYVESAAEDARRRESPRGGNPSPLPGEADTTASAPVPNELRGDIPTTPPADVKSVEHAQAATVPSQQPLPSKPAEPPKPAEPQPADAAVTEPPPAGPAAPSPRAWLKCTENGEPYEAKLADGTVIKLDTYGDEYEGYDYQSPMNAEKGDILIDYRRLHRDGVYAGGIRLDLKHKKMYWGETPGGDHPSSILRANLDGTRIETVIDRNPLRPSSFVLDVEGGKIYWTNLGRTNGDGRSIQCANLDGSQTKTIVPRLKMAAGLAIDAAARKLYYFDDKSLLRSELDGSNEERVLVGNATGAIFVDSPAQLIYWTGSYSTIRRARCDGSGISDAANGGGRIRHLVLDDQNGKLYWTEEGTGHIRRAGLNGSQVEDVIVGIVGPTGLAVDFKTGFIYWMESFADDDGVGNSRVRRVKLPPLQVRVKKPAPPLVTQIQPGKQHAGGEVVVSGRHLAQTKAVELIDDASGDGKTTTFRVRSDDAIVVTIPRLSKGCRHPVLVINGVGGTTATFPRTARFGHHEAADRFRPADEFAYLVPAKAEISIDRGVVFAQASSVVTPLDRGHNVFFLKNGALIGFRRVPSNVVYFEPFALINDVEKLPEGTKLVPVPAIRPSFVESLLEYEE